MITIIKKRYIIKNIRRKQKLIKYAYIIINTIKVIKIIIVVQIFLLYNNLKLKFRRNLIKSIDIITINAFF